MNGSQAVMGLSLFVVLVGLCSVSESPMAGVIQIRGAILEPPCSAVVSANLTLKLQGCPTVIGEGVLNVSPVEPISHVVAVNHNSVKARLITNRQPSAAADNQEYLLVNASGQTIRSGSYMVTINYP
ncbi:hypothetical protein [Pseudomonas sp. EL_65y_Pfl2_R95]|uniref:hypothetical protein n=1 Tax=Pseudomonas sp. EL_65y_Pfl2_R95 TaxID=3088698 RepID=UPI0030D84E09